MTRAKTCQRTSKYTILPENVFTIRKSVEKHEIGFPWIQVNDYRNGVPKTLLNVQGENDRRKVPKIENSPFAVLYSRANQCSYKQLG